MNLKQKLEEEMKRHEDEMKRLEERMMKLFFTKQLRDRLMATDEDVLKKLPGVILDNYDKLHSIAEKRLGHAAPDVPEKAAAEQTAVPAADNAAGGGQTWQDKRTF